MSNIAISVRNLTKTYKLYQQPIDRLKEALHPLKKSYHKNFNALDGVSFEINRGKTVGIIGRNGSGKSTLLKLITGVLTPTSGRAIVHGRVSAILELGAGFNGEMTGLENIYLNNTINGIPESETKKRVQQIIEFAELGEFIHQPLKTYSSGMKARLAFAVAINVEPDILIVDEALSVGDAAFQRKCFAKMEEIRKSGATILFVSHSEASIVSLCNRAIWLANGAKVLDGSPKLVTGLYLKYMNSCIDVNKIQCEYKKLSEEIKSIKNKGSANKKNPDLEIFDPTIKSTSTIRYKSYGVEIYEPFISSDAGKKVNILIHGRTYFYNHGINVNISEREVRLGIGIKDLKGNIISGGVYPELVNSIKLFKGFYSVSWRFKCNLNSGFYTTNCGVLGMDGQVKFLHRIVDALMFKVVEEPSSYQKTGSVDLNYVIDVTKVG